MANSSLFDAYRESIDPIISFIGNDEELLSKLSELAHKQTELVVDLQARRDFIYAIQEVVSEPLVSNALLRRNSMIPFSFGDYNSIATWLDDVLNQRTGSSQEETIEKGSKDTDAKSLEHDLCESTVPHTFEMQKLSIENAYLKRYVEDLKSINSRYEKVIESLVNLIDRLNSSKSNK